MAGVTHHNADPVLALVGLNEAESAQVASWAASSGWSTVVIEDHSGSGLKVANPDLVLACWKVLRDPSRQMAALKLMMAAVPEAQFAVLTGEGTESYQTAAEAMRVGVRDYVEYPLQEAEISSLLTRVENRFGVTRRLTSVEAQVRHLRTRLDSIEPIPRRRSTDV